MVGRAKWIALAQTEVLTAVVTPTGEHGTLKVQQDAILYRLQLTPNEQVQMPTRDMSRQLYVQLVEGTLKVNDVELTPGDGAHITAEQAVLFSAYQGSVTALVFDLA
ncbi:hypothetical protein SIL85_19945 [Shewanella oneidensis]|uniref:pirin family protein n=1 Tax=Shewanella oneidensis TaxID=70863 RepID=UPI00000E21B3|nr:hypothetical protein [Shewanella oneidensis]MDX5999257.1 hypothetical protein [Shewanella oneidensis]MEE2029118.1 hypothetical protein [Shewanella oneidensis]